MKKIVALLLLAVLICSCAPSIARNNSNLMTLKPGMAQEDVTAIMGAPTLSELYEAADGKLISILYYRTEKKKTTVLSASDECTPLVFSNGKLQGWGDRLTAAHVNQLKVKTKP